MILILNSDEKAVAALTNNGSPNSAPYYNDVMKEHIDTGAATYEFYVPSNHDVVNNILEGGYVVRADLDGNYRMFQIMQVIDTHAGGASLNSSGGASSKYVYAEDAGLELIDDVIRPTTYTDSSAQNLVESLLLGQRWKVGNIDQSFAVQTYTYSNYETILAGLQAAATQMGGELSFRVTIANGQVSGRYVDLVKQRGTATYKRFVYSKDIVSIKRTVDMTQMATALIGVGGNNLTFSSLNYTKAANGFDKPANQDWVGDPDALQQYGRQGQHIFRQYQVSNATSADDLLQKTWTQLQIIKNPSVTYTLQVSLLERLAGIQHEKVRIGDTVYIIDETFNPVLRLSARVMELDTCFSDPMQDACTLGNYKVVQSSINYQLQQIQSTLLQKASTWDTAVTDTQYLKDNMQFTVQLTSSQGTTFKNGQGTTTITAKVMQGNSDVTNSLPNSAFSWKRFDKYGVPNEYFQGVGPSISVNASDINIKNIYECDVDCSSLTIS